jgi:prepilin-type N-terminal cleavage/methylation domain-containing protein
MCITAIRQRGFTIVELLIVIVVIAILAAISIAAYNGIQNRANDTAIQNDLATLAKKIELYKANYGTYPTGLETIPTLDDGLYKISLTKSAYKITDLLWNAMYCIPAANNYTGYAILGISKSDKRFYATNTSGGVREYTGGTSWSGSVAVACSSVLSGSPASGGNMGYNNSTAPYGWRPWTD